VVIILDDVGHLLFACPPYDDASHLKRRCQATFLNMMDMTRACCSKWRGSVLVLCTSAADIGSLSSRFDRRYRLNLPQDSELREMIIKTLGIRHEENLGPALTGAVESCVGKSFAEIAQYCRDAIVNVVMSADSTASSNTTDSKTSGIEFEEAVLRSLKLRLLSVTPASLRDSMLDDYVDMRVLGAKDLDHAVAPFIDDGVRSAQDQPTVVGGYDLPLRGNSATDAWKALEASIVVPLCRSRELDRLIHGGTSSDSGMSSSRRMVTGGALLNGEPGSGKTAIALHCARYASRLLPSIKVLDVSCTSLIHKEVGGSERAVHRLFDAARKAAPCIVLMDGIENVAAVRGNDATTEGTLDRVLSTLLVELDGFDANESQSRGSIAVIGITQDKSWIDPALKRPGRLEKVIDLSIDWS